MSSHPDQEIKTQLRRLFKQAPQPQSPPTIEIRLASLEKKIDTLETRLWAMMALVAGAELVRLIVGR